MLGQLSLLSVVKRFCIEYCTGPAFTMISKQKFGSLQACLPTRTTAAVGQFSPPTEPLSIAAMIARRTIEGNIYRNSSSNWCLVLELFAAQPWGQQFAFLPSFMCPRAFCFATLEQRAFVLSASATFSTQSRTSSCRRVLYLYCSAVSSCN